MDQSQLMRCWKTGLVPISEHRLTGPPVVKNPVFLVVKLETGT